jgi:hypothetical protein
MQSTGHEITWTEFKKAFKDHHIPKGIMVRKMKVLLALKQGDDILYQYAQKFNSLFQYRDLTGRPLSSPMWQPPDRSSSPYLSRLG